MPDESFNNSDNEENNMDWFRSGNALLRDGIVQLFLKVGLEQKRVEGLFRVEKHHEEEHHKQK